MNLNIRDIQEDVKFEDVKDDPRDLMRYHEIPSEIKRFLRGRKLRDALRDMMNWKLAYEVAKQVIPNAMKKELQVTLSFFEDDEKVY